MSRINLVTKPDDPSAPAATQRAPLVVLVQGGIASGKSTITRLLVEQGARYVDCDRMAHEILESPEVADVVLARFGSEVRGEGDSRISRPKLGAIVFSDPAALADLEALIHPRVRDRVQGLAAAAAVAADRPRQVLVIDAAVAPKMKLVERYDLRLFVAADLETRRRRAAQRGWAPGELEQREANQTPVAAKQAAADFVVPNDGDLAEAESHVKRFWIEFVEPRR